MILGKIWKGGKGKNVEFMGFVRGVCRAFRVILGCEIVER